MKKLVKKLQYIKEVILYGNHISEFILVSLLKNYYKSLYKREQYLADEPPHFTNFRPIAFNFLYNTSKFPKFYRGFYSSELINQGDTVLDIGCGDGFLTSRFLSSNANKVDAVDIDKDAIKLAKKQNQNNKINYYLLNAVNEDFPSPKYDVVVWDGAIGHFSSKDMDIMMKKIASAIGENGVFAGSESLGLEGHDHLQFFDTEKDLHNLLKKYFKHVQVKSLEYKIGPKQDKSRTEGFFRCSNNGERLTQTAWKQFE